jgi:glycosyltransferase involved in cell wall biosynthesis
MEKKPKVSVCIPAYNSSRYIGETISSLLAQSYPNLEIIVIDNDSTDGTLEAIMGFSDNRLICKHFDKLLPPCENWNRCFGLANGEYVAVYHSDDIYEKDAISKGVEFLEKNNECAAVFSSATLISGVGREIGSIGRPQFFSSGKADAKELVDFSVRNGYFPLICPTFLARASAVKKCGKFDCSFKYAFDMDYYMRLLEFGKIGILEEKLIRYRQHPLQGSVRLNDVMDTQREFFVILEREMGKRGISLSNEDRRRLDSYRRWGKVVDALTHIRAKSKHSALMLAKEGFAPSDALIDFPSLRFLWREAFTSLFLAAQYAGLGGAFASAVFWYRARKRRD